MGTHPIFESDFDCLTDIFRMAKGKKGKKSKQDEDAEWDALEAKKTAQAAEPKPAAEPKKGKGKKSKAAAFMADLEEELKDEDLVNKMASVSVEEGLSKSQLKGTLWSKSDFEVKVIFGRF